MKRKIVDPVTNTEIWVVVDEAGNIIESNVPAPEDDEKALAEKAKQDKTKLLEEELANLKRVSVIESESMKEQLAKLTELVTKLSTPAPPIVLPAEEKEKIVYMDNPENTGIIKNLSEKVTELSKYKAETEHMAFISAQIKSKPYMSEIVKKLNITTREDYIKIAMPLEEMQEEANKIREKVASNQNRDISSEYGYVGTISKATSAEQKIIDKGIADAEALFDSLIY